MSFAGLKVHSCFPCIPDLLSLLVCLFCPLCVSVVTFDSKDKDKREVCGGSSCSSKDDGLIRLVCAFSVFVCYSFVILLLSTEVLLVTSSAFVCVICAARFVPHQAPDHQGHLDRQGCWDRAIHCCAGPGGDGRDRARAGESCTCSHFST